MSGLDSPEITVNKVADMQLKSTLGKDILLLPPVYEVLSGPPASDECCAAVGWAPYTETERRRLSARKAEWR